MNRKDFIRVMGVAPLAACAGCLRQEYSYPAPTVVDFTLDLTVGNNKVLTSPGSWLGANGVIIIHVLTGEFLAFSRACSHLGASLMYLPSQNTLMCPRHYSYFDITGFPINGPATVPLRKYKVELNGDLLHVTTYS